MVRVTSYLVQSFSAGRGAALKADKPMACKSADGARPNAWRRPGVVAYSSSGECPAITTTRRSISSSKAACRPSSRISRGGGVAGAAMAGWITGRLFDEAPPKKPIPGAFKMLQRSGPMCSTFESRAR